MSASSESDLGKRLAAVLAHRLPGFESLLSMTQLSSGASQETYRLAVRIDGNEHLLALRRAIKGAPKASIPWAPSIEAEAELMTAARHAGVPSPEVHHVFRPEDGLGHGFIMQWLEGETLGSRIVRSEALAAARARLAYQCGEILGRIHSIDVSATGLERSLRRLTPAELLGYAIDWYGRFDVAHPMLEYAVRWLQTHLPSHDRMTLVHNDFRNGNLVVGPTGIVAVLDWEHAFIGEPMRDLGWVCTNSWRFGRSDLPVGGFGTYDDLFAGYEAITGIRVDPAVIHFWEVFGAFWWAVGCLELASQYHKGLDRGIERLAIERRVSECEADCVNLLIPGTVSVTAPDIVPGTTPVETLALLEGVTAFLLNDIAVSQRNRTGYLARVAANTLEIVQRDLAQGPAARTAETARLQQLLSRRGSLLQLRRALVERLRHDPAAMTDPAIQSHLRATAAAQIAIDQPRYSGLQIMLGREMSM